MATLLETFEERRQGLHMDTVYWLMMSKINPVAIAAKT